MRLGALGMTKKSGICGEVKKFDPTIQVIGTSVGSCKPTSRPDARTTEVGLEERSPPDAVSGLRGAVFSFVVTEKLRHGNEKLVRRPCHHNKGGG